MSSTALPFNCSRTKSTTNPNTTTGEPTIMSTTAKSTTSKVGAVSTKPKPAAKPAAKKAPVAKPEADVTDGLKATKTTTKVEHPKPAPVAGHTHLKLRTERNVEIIAAHCTVKGAISVSGPWVTVTNSKAQELFDQLNESGKSAAIFDRRVIDFFTAELAIARPTIKDDRTSVHAKVLAAGRDGLKTGALDSFAFEMKTDGTLKVNVQSKGGQPVQFPTQRDALASFAA